METARLISCSPWLPTTDRSTAGDGNKTKSWIPPLRKTQRSGGYTLHSSTSAPVFLPDPNALEMADIKGNYLIRHPFKQMRYQNKKPVDVRKLPLQGRGVPQKVRNQLSELEPLQIFPEKKLRNQTVMQIAAAQSAFGQPTLNIMRSAPGRLLKGHLKPLSTFNRNGPPIEDCAGIHPLNQDYGSIREKPVGGLTNRLKHYLVRHPDSVMDQLLNPHEDSFFQLPNVRKDYENARYRTKNAGHTPFAVYKQLTSLDSFASSSYKTGDADVENHSFDYDTHYLPEKCSSASCIDYKDTMSSRSSICQDATSPHLIVRMPDVSSTGSVADLSDDANDNLSDVSSVAEEIVNDAIRRALISREAEIVCEETFRKILNF